MKLNVNGSYQILWITIIHSFTLLPIAYFKIFLIAQLTSSPILIKEGKHKEQAHVLLLFKLNSKPSPISLSNPRFLRNHISKIY